MKLKRVVLDGFRGAAIPVELRLDEKSICIHAENGHGKTTWVDGLEFWSSGDVRHYHREGYGLDCLVHVDAIQATVSAEVTGLPLMSRTLTAGAPSALQPAGPVPVGTTVPPLPILRHRTMADFMQMTPGEKKKALLDVLGLAQLTDFRQTLKTTCTTFERRQKDAQTRAGAESAALRALLGDRDLVALAEDLRKRAGVTQPISHPDALLTLDVAITPTGPAVDRVARIGELARALAAVNEATPKAWNEAVEDRSFAVDAAMTALIKDGQRVLETWDEATCPLCRQPKELDELRDELRARAAEFRDAEVRVAEIAAQVDTYITALRALKQAIDSMITVAPSTGWPDQAKLATAARSLGDHLNKVAVARRDSAPLPDISPVDIPATVALEAAAKKDAESAKPAVALAELVRLRDQLARVEAVEADRASAEKLAGSTSALLEIADCVIRREVEAAISRIGAVAADYYGRLVSNPVYSDVKLEYRTGRAGGIEFALRFDGRHRVSPPQRVMSDSQLNALGLALFLARLQVDPQIWKTVVLDDVVNSFDSAHRVGLTRLLAEEFSDWQVFLVTHDRVFATVARKMLPSWKFASIAAWTPSGGPVLADGIAREQLRARIAEGRAAGELGGLARVALEQGLSLPLEKLGLEIRYDPLARYSAHDYLTALRRGLKARKSSLATLPLLARMEADSYLVNIGAHDRPADPALSAEDLQRLVDDLVELQAAFICSACSEPVWTATLDGGQHHQCRCSTLAV